MKCSGLSSGEFQNVPLGKVDVIDEDDWDTPNKTFTLVDDDVNRIFRFLLT